MKISADISGLEKIAQGLKSSTYIRREVSPHFKQMSADLFAYAISEAPRDRGQLKDSIELKFQGLLTSTIGTDDAKCPYAKFVYMGTRDHDIRPVNKKSLAFFPSGSMDRIMRKGVHVRGIKPNPYLWRSYIYHEKELVSNLEQGFKEVLESL